MSLFIRGQSTSFIRCVKWTFDHFILQLVFFHNSNVLYFMFAFYRLRKLILYTSIKVGIQLVHTISGCIRFCGLCENLCQVRHLHLSLLGLIEMKRVSWQAETLSDWAAGNVSHRTSCLLDRDTVRHFSRREVKFKISCQLRSKVTLRSQREVNELISGARSVNNQWDEALFMQMSDAATINWEVDIDLSW